MTEEPMSHETKNSPWDDRFTCPGCYSDFDTIQEGTHTCPECDRDVECEIEHAPVYVARIME